VTVCLGDNCNTFVAQSIVSLVIKCVIGGISVTCYNKVRGVGGGSKSDPIAFAVGRRQKVLESSTIRSGIESLKRNRENSRQQPLPGSLGKGPKLSRWPATFFILLAESNNNHKFANFYCSMSTGVLISALFSGLM
jgi:hypothetical protein